MPTTPYTIRIDNELRQALELEAKLADQPAAQLAAQAVKSMVQTKTAKREAIEAALAEADAGRFISEDAMNLWMDSWGSTDELPMPEPDITPAQS